MKKLETENTTNTKKPIENPEEIGLLKTKLKNLEESYNVKCREYNALYRAYENLSNKHSKMCKALVTLTKSYNLSLDLLLQNEEE